VEASFPAFAACIMNPRLVGALCVALSAASFGAMAIFARQAYAGGADVTAVLLLCFAIAAAIVFAALAGWEQPAFPATAPAWAAVFAIAIVCTVVAMLGLFVGIRHLGAADAATLSTLEPVVTIVLAAIFLGEAFTPLQILGGAIVLTAVVWLARTGGQLPA
jgi:drug/metabolite transporter (DMT)-like permease